MTRPKLLLSLVGILGLVWIGLWIAQGWGTVTLVFEKKPLSTVLRSFTSQSKLKVITDIDLNTPITIQVRRVPVAEALEALQAAAESRGSLAVLLAPDTVSMKNLLSTLPNPKPDSGTLSIEYRTPWLFRGTINSLPIDRDPREQIWSPSPQLTLQLLPLLEHAAQTTEVRLVIPQSWNPTLQKAPSAGPLSSSIPKLAKSAGGQAELVYLLPTRAERDSPANSPSSSEANRSPLRWTEPAALPPEALLTRLESRIRALPSSEQEDARQAAQESVRQYREWSSLTTEEERDKKRQEMMNDPVRAERAGEGFSRAMRKMSPEQRSQRYQRYVQRRAAQKGG
ncbi:MAG: hypothetical protein EBS97_02775 [Verrucomicrobia bacterium]|nr:hypothetical protein [Verrucomicrobiota bacterium]